MPVETPAFVGPQFPNLTDRLLAVGHRSTDSGYKTAPFKLQAEPQRLYLRIQNENNTTVLFLKFGEAAKTAPASATDYDVALAAASAANAGNGGVYECWNNTEFVDAFSGTVKAAVLEIVL